MANFINKYRDITEYNSDGSRQYPNISLIEGRDGGLVYKRESDMQFTFESDGKSSTVFFFSCLGGKPSPANYGISYETIEDAVAAFSGASYEVYDVEVDGDTIDVAYTEYDSQNNAIILYYDEDDGKGGTVQVEIARFGANNGNAVMQIYNYSSVSFTLTDGNIHDTGNDDL